jgi:hypothetical protein
MPTLENAATTSSYVSAEFSAYQAMPEDAPFDPARVCDLVGAMRDMPCLRNGIAYDRHLSVKQGFSHKSMFRRAAANEQFDPHFDIIGTLNPERAEQDNTVWSAQIAVDGMACEVQRGAEVASDRFLLSFMKRFADSWQGHDHQQCLSTDVATYLETFSDATKKSPIDSAKLCRVVDNMRELGCLQPTELCLNKTDDQALDSLSFMYQQVSKRQDYKSTRAFSDPFYAIVAEGLVHRDDSNPSRSTVLIADDTSAFLKRENKMQPDPFLHGIIEKIAGSWATHEHEQCQTN